MRILVIGNGFDLAHGLKTGYSDFMAFVESMHSLQEFLEDNHAHVSDGISQSAAGLCRKSWGGLGGKLFENCGEDGVISQTGDVLKLIKKNVWLEYFRGMNSRRPEKWCDLEA
ncbi:MAG: hypothetical protein IJU50_03415, partial [Lachnospiraceae bacterium]|nr:hypothetical protein [Lachnospiraceae bacterium]